MTGMPLEPLGPDVFQFPCLDESDAYEICGGLKQVTLWEPAPVRKTTRTPTAYGKISGARGKSERASRPRCLRVSRTGRARAEALATQLSIGHVEMPDLRAVRYDQGGFFKIHTDTTGTDGRRFAIVIYLNDDFQGGATVFPLLGCRAIPKTGRGVVFPADWLHRGDVVSAGTKYILVMWLENSKPGWSLGTHKELPPGSPSPVK